MKAVRVVVAGIILFIAFGAAMYTQRMRLSDLWADMNRPELPASVGYNDLPSEEPEPVEEEPELDGEGTPEEPEPEEEGSAPEEEEDPVPEPEEPDAFPVEFNLGVPFTSQAPFANWDHTHEETCEEASVYMVHLYYEGVAEGQVDAQTAEDELLRMVEFEKELFGYFEDTTAAETKQFIEEFYGYDRVELVMDPTVEDMKGHIAAGRPIIVPAAGRLLGNPYFSGEGPDYHMLLVRGYTADRFITNDPGTRRGEAFTYDIDTFMNAIHDWKPGDVNNGQPVVIVIYPE